MKKLFLTSGLVVCMACPAFASTENVAGGDGQCVTGNIGVTEGSTNLQAKWTSAFTEITLNNNADNGYGSGNAYSCSLTGTNACATENTKIYGVASGATGGNKVWKDKDANGNLSGDVATGGVLLTSTPVGASVNYTINPNFEYISAQGGDTYTAQSGTYTAGSCTAANRAFNGMYSAATGGVQLVDGDGELLAAGLTAAQTGSPTTWYAQYGDGDPTNCSAPTLTGYHMDPNSSTYYTTRAAAPEYTPSNPTTLSGISSNTTVYAKFVPNTYTVTYAANKPAAALAANSVSGMPASNGTATYDRAFTPASAPSLTGFTFKNWSSNYDLSAINSQTATTYNAGAQAVSRWKTTNNVTMTAQWDINVSTISFDNGYSGSRSGCPVAGDNGAFSAATATAGAPTSLTTVYGVGVYSSADGVTKDNYGSKTAITKLTTNPSRTGYDFGGYYTAANGGGTQMIGATINATQIADGLKTWKGGSTQGDTGTLYAKWTPHTYTITYSCGTAITAQSLKSGASATQTTTYDMCYTLAEGSAKCDTPAGFTFGGWSCSATLPNATKTLPAAGDVAKFVGANEATETSLYAGGAGGIWNVDNVNNVTCTAKWKSNNITINYDSNNGSAVATPGSCMYSGSVTLPDNPTRAGYTFSGWKVNN